MTGRNNQHSAVGVDIEGLEAVVRALKAEEDGKELRKDLVKELRQVMKPATDHAKAGIMGMASTGRSHSAPALRSSIAKRIRPEVKLSGFGIGIRVKAKRTANVRNFRNAPKRTQSPNRWRHPVFGNRDVWVTQRGKPGWFDDSFRSIREPAMRAVHEVLERMAERISSRGRG